MRRFNPSSPFAVRCKIAPRSLIERMEPRLLMAATLLKDINPGNGASFPLRFTEFNSLTYFQADDGVHGAELCSSDGTPAGTKLVTNINEVAKAGGIGGDQSSDPDFLVAGGDQLFFSADDGVHGSELWWTDGTDAGTGGFDINISSAGADSRPQELIYLPKIGKVIFSANDGVNGRQLWVSNGTAVGTTMLGPFGANFNPSLPVVLGNSIVFWGTGAAGTELWISNGTTAGTRQIRDINPAGNAGPTTMVTVGSHVLFAANDGSHGFELWQTDGNTAALIDDINPTTDPDTGENLSSFPAKFTVVGDEVFFRATDGVHGPEIWSVKNGIAAMIRDINPGSAASDPTFFIAFNGKVYFRAKDGVHGDELWSADHNGASLIKDIDPGASGSNIGSPVALEDKIYFSADDTAHGDELWESDGTAGGTVIHKDINPGTNDSSPSELVNISDQLYFYADDGSHGYEPWATEKGVSGRVLVRAVEGKAFSGSVYFFSVSDLKASASNYTATIYWGDGETSSGTIKASTKTSSAAFFAVSGTHTYDEEGGYPIVVKIHNVKKKTDTTGAVNLSHATGDQFEGTVAIDPTDPKRIYVRSNNGTLGDFSSYTTNGGLTWTSKFVGKGTDKLPASNGDPKAAFDQYGNLFVSHLSLDAKKIIILLSKDGGKTFTVLTSLTANQDINGLDQPSIAVGPGRDGEDGSLWCSFKSLRDQIVLAGASVTGLGKVGSFTQQTVAGSLAGNFGDVAVGPKGQVMVNWQSPPAGNSSAEIQVATDFDGLGPKKVTKGFRVITTNVAERAIPAQPIRTVDAEANLAFDRSGGRYDGWLYMAYTNAPSTTSVDTDIYIIVSEDDGETWRAPLRISDDTKHRSQFLPSIAVDDETGQVVVFWHDARNDPNNVSADVFATMSSDGGKTWTDNIQINSGASTPSRGSPNDYGDYTSVALFDGLLVPVWADNSKGLGSNPAIPTFDMAANCITVAQVEDAPLHATKKDITVARYRSATAVVATFTDENPKPEIKDFSAKIDWGDGKTSTGKISASGKGFKVSGTHVYTTLAASVKVHVTISDIGGSTAEVEGTAVLINPPAAPIAAVGADAGGKPTVLVIDPRSGATVGTFQAYDASFKGGVRVAVGDVNGDSFLDIITAPGPGAGAFGQVRVFDGISFALFSSNNGILEPYGAEYTGGINLACAEVNGDTTDDIIIAAGPGARQPVKVFNGADGTVLKQFNAYDAKFVGGVNVAAGDVDGDGKAEVITGPGAGPAHGLRVWNAATGALFLPQIFPFGSSFKGGFNVASGRFDSDGKADIAASSADAIKLFRGTDLAAIGSVPGYETPPAGGIRLGVWDSNNDGTDELILAAGRSSASLPVRFLKTLSGDVLRDVYPFGKKYTAGSFIAAADI